MSNKAFVAQKITTNSRNNTNSENSNKLYKKVDNQKYERRNKKNNLIRKGKDGKDTKELQALSPRRKSEDKLPHETSCPRTFKDKELDRLTMHARFECGPKDSSSPAQRYKCAQCGRSYKYEKSLPLHIRFECGRKDCPSSVRVPDSDTIKNYECTHCGHTFHSEEVRDFHTHFECNLNQTDFSTTTASTSNNYSEVEVSEEVQPRCKCGICGRSYKYEKSLILHHRFDCSLKT